MYMCVCITSQDDFGQTADNCLTVVCRFYMLGRHKRSVHHRDTEQLVQCRAVEGGDTGQA